MNATEFDRDLRILTDELGEKYIKLKDLEWAGHKDNEVKEMLYYGHIARVEEYKANFSQWQKTAKK